MAMLNSDTRWSFFLSALQVEQNVSRDFLSNHFVNGADIWD